MVATCCCCFLRMHLRASFGMSCRQCCAHASSVHHKAAQMLLHSLPHGLVRKEFGKHTCRDSLDDLNQAIEGGSVVDWHTE